MERGNLRAKYPDIFSELKREFAEWNEEMLPYSKTSFSGDLNGGMFADRYGVEKSFTGEMGNLPAPQ